jgi:hypothetical protein
LVAKYWGPAASGDVQGAGQLVEDIELGARAGEYFPHAYDGRQVRPGAWVAGISDMLNLDGWPKGIQIIVRKERPHPGAQLRFTDIGGHRFTCSQPAPKAASSPTWSYAAAVSAAAGACGLVSQADVLG